MLLVHYHQFFIFFFFNDTATTEIYTLSLHDALPILSAEALFGGFDVDRLRRADGIAQGDRSREGKALPGLHDAGDRKSTRLNSSHANISYAVFCLKKKTKYCSLLWESWLRH